MTSTSSSVSKSWAGEWAELITKDFPSLWNSEEREELYVKTNNDRYVFENMLYTSKTNRKDYDRGERGSSVGIASSRSDAIGGLAMRPKDFLASIPSFADFSDEQLTALEAKAEHKRFESGEVIFRQGEKGEDFYVIYVGAVDVLIQENTSLLRKGDLGRIVNRLTEGCYFGERALMTAEVRAASIRVIQDTMCYKFSRSVYEEVISASNALTGADDDVDWSRDHETRSLYKHIESILEIDKIDASRQIKRILYELGTAFTPELSVDEVISRMVMTVKMALKVDRVGLFVLSEDKRSMVLKVSERSKGVRLPVRGLAGAVLLTNTAINIPDAYKDNRFDATMDRRTGYRTRQILGVPLRHPLTGEAIGLLQVNNRLDGGLEGFTMEQQRILELATEQLSELLHGRADVFIHSGSVGGHKTFGQGVGDGIVLVNSAEAQTPFTIDLFNIGIGGNFREIVIKESVVGLELVVSLHLSLGKLCPPQSARFDLPPALFSGTKRKSGVRDVGEPTAFATIGERLVFDLAVRDLPRATRVLFRLVGLKKKGTTSIGSGSNSSNTIVPLGWAAATLFDFKGCLDCNVKLFFFPGSVENPISTTLSNVNGEEVATTDRSSNSAGRKDSVISSGINTVSNLTAMMAPDLVLASDSSTPRVRVVHSMPNRGDEPIEGERAIRLSDAHMMELDRILMLSFNPLSMNMITDADRDFLWEIRYSILNRADLLPAFVMAVRWENAEHVQELYDLLDLWEPPSSPVQALQLLDRRFMDPKVRAFAAHCLEELSDEELSLYMLQLCQQLKFENYIDSALSRFLLRRALMNKKLIGHMYFWLLESEVYNKDVRKRFVILLQIYIRNCGKYRVELGHQMFVMKRLEKVAEAVKQGETKADRKQILRDKLNEIVLPTTFKLPLNPHLTVCGIDVSKCRVMESKKKPLWLTMKNADKTKSDCVLMLKVGDDLRQDALIMQLLRVMNELWKKEGLDMQMMLYDCISTGYERGLLQVVLNATTLGSILMDATDRKNSNGAAKSGTLTRKISSALRALSDFNVIRDWITEQAENDTTNISKVKLEIEKRVQNFMISTAAYCVASYVLGLGDRHNDNLMITKSGHFFHIDFGHILGNFKFKMGVKRERAPFVFTPAMKAVMRDDQYEAFLDLCCDIYNILRENSILLVSLFTLAIPCNLPELQEEKDVMWIYEKLLIGQSDEAASEHFRKQLDISLNTRGTRLNDAAHMLAHA